MRISDKSFNSRPSNIREVHKKIYFAFEGIVTEKRYFTKLFNTLNPSGIYPIHFYRDSNHGSSNPAKIVEEIQEIISGESPLELTYEGLVDILCRYAKEKTILFQVERLEES